MRRFTAVDGGHNAERLRSSFLALFNGYGKDGYLSFVTEHQHISQRNLLLSHAFVDSNRSRLTLPGSG